MPDFTVGTASTHSPHVLRAWDDDDKPVIPKIPGPRAPKAMSGGLYTVASAVADCPVHRAQHAEFETRRAEYDAAIDRLERRRLRQLDLRFSRAARQMAVTA